MSGEQRPNDDPAQPYPGPGQPAAPRRWLCRCSVPPVLLATLERGNVNLKIRDRYYHIEGLHGRVRATCPRCGQQHTIELSGMMNGG